MSKTTMSALLGGLFVLAVFVFDYSQAPDREILIDRSAPPRVAEESLTLTPMPSSSMPVIISDSRVQHILYGDENGKGGGHLFGTGKPCKSEFPAAWDADKVIDVTRRIAANDNLNWERQGNGYHVAEGYEGDVRVRVVKGPQKRRVITAYPTNVERNPCPDWSPANDR